MRTFRERSTPPKRLTRGNALTYMYESKCTLSPKSTFFPRTKIKDITHDLMAKKKKKRNKRKSKTTTSPARIAASPTILYEEDQGLQALYKGKSGNVPPATRHIRSHTAHIETPTVHPYQLELEKHIVALEDKLEQEKQHLETLRRLLAEQKAETHRWKQAHQEECEAKERYLRRGDTYLREKQELEVAKQHAEARATLPTLSTHLSKRGIPTHLHVGILQQLIQLHGTKLIHTLKIHEEHIQPLLSNTIHLRCTHPDCQPTSSDELCVTVENPQMCEYCSGSENKRAFRLLVDDCRERGWHTLTIVGGSPDTHAELQDLCPADINLRIIEGTSRRTKKQATQDIETSDLVLIWGATILPHSLSELYTSQRQHDHIISLRCRGVASLARQTLQAIEQLPSH